MNFFGYGYDNHTRYNQQESLQVSKMKVTQLQDQALSNDTMCRVLTLAEKYAIGQNDKYASYNLSSAEGEDLLRLLVREIEIFRLSYEDYVEEYESYDFPGNQSKNQIIDDVESWKNEVDVKDRKYYDILIQILKLK